MVGLVFDIPTLRCYISRYGCLATRFPNLEHRLQKPPVEPPDPPAQSAYTMAYSQPFPRNNPAVEKTPQPQTFGPDLAVRLICPDCRDPNPNIVEEFSSGDLVCGTCGLVLGDRVVDTRSEWRVSTVSF